MLKINHSLINLSPQPSMYFDTIVSHIDYFENHSIKANEWDVLTQLLAVATDSILCYGRRSLLPLHAFYQNSIELEFD